MDFKKIFKTLQTLGTEQNKKTYKKHGVTNDLFGVSYANINKLKKQIKQNQTLAESLWKTHNHDACILACYIADPKKIKEATLDQWVKTLCNYVISDAFSKLVAQTPFAKKKMQQWSQSKEEWVGRSGWLILAHLARNSKNLKNVFFEDYLKIIESTLHHRPNRTKDAMNSALIAIGIKNPSLQKKATLSAKKIGKVIVDHGQTNCKTPNAASYIEKTIARNQALKNKKKSS